MEIWREPYVYGLDYMDDILLLGVEDERVVIKKNNRTTKCKIYYSPTDRAYFKARKRTYYLDDFIPKTLG